MDNEGLILNRKYFALLILVVPLLSLSSITLIIGDYELFSAINLGLSNSIFDVLLSYIFPLLFFASYLITLLGLWKSHKKTNLELGAISAVNGFISYGFGSLIKLVIQRPRPITLLQYVRIVGPFETNSFSFPSTTTMLVFGFAIPFLLFYDKHHSSITLTILSYLVGFAVIYTGFHFPTDVIGAILFSIFIVVFTKKLVEYLFRYVIKLLKITIYSNIS
jgi:membrane-associated phospholipid phosphatase